MVADRWTYLTTVDPFTTIMVSPTRIYLVEQLTQVERSLEGTEQIETVIMPFADALAKVTLGEITHAPTCVALLMAGNLRG